MARAEIVLTQIEIVEYGEMDGFRTWIPQPEKPIYYYTNHGFSRMYYFPSGRKTRDGLPIFVRNPIEG